LRESVKDILPSKIYTRYDKKGFSTPADQWFRTPSFVKYINELLNSSSFKNRGYFDIKDCKEKYKKHLEGKADLSKDIWKWINLEVWFQKCIEN
jgi:asparagine synthase (glutamine-hydrolysing)